MQQWYRKFSVVSVKLRKVNNSLEGFFFFFLKHFYRDEPFHWPSHLKYRVFYTNQKRSLIFFYFALAKRSLKANMDGLRQKPDSFYHLRYHSQVIFDFKAFDGVKRYARFRLIPADGSPETGLLSEDVQWHPW